jgi:hypothetical protein
MNIFCYPSVTRRTEVCSVLGLEPGSVPERLELHHLRQRCPDAPGWQHLDYFRVVTIRPEQRQENVRKPADLICRP